MDRKVGVVTGAGGDIGVAVCEALGRRGLGVLCIDRTAELAERAAAAVRAAGGIGEAMAADVSVEGDAMSYAARAQQLWGNANFFFNNAGIEGVDAPITSYPLAEWDRVMAVNLRGVYLGLRAMFPLLHHAETPRVVNTASVAGMIATPMLSAYGASKHAVIGLTKTAAVEWAAHGIAVNAICPGPVESGMMRRIEAGLGDASAAKARYEQIIPASRYAKLSEVAELAVYLLIDAPLYLTGQAIALDGALSVS